MHRPVLGFLALVAGLSIATASNSAPGRIGCFEDTAARVWKQWGNRHEKNTVNVCTNICQEFKYAGVEAGNWCMCGDELPPKKLPDSRCNRVCLGDQNQTCGGEWALEVFAVEPKQAMLGKPVGCFQDGVNRVWKNGLMQLQSTTPQRCFNACRGFRYAGVEAGDWCACGDSVPDTLLPKTSCDVQCFGLTGKSCGGRWTIEVFEISEAPTPGPAAPAPTAPPKSCPEVVPCECPSCPVQAPVVPPVQTVGCIPMDYKPHDDLGTYKLYGQRKSWDDAWQQCEDDDAHLLIINSEDEAEFVRSLFAQVPSETRMHAGFHDLLRRGTYRTLFGEPLSSTGYGVWSTEFPQTPSALKHCGCVDVRAQLAQVDGNCEAQAVFVCEKKADSPDASGHSVDLDLDPRGGGRGTLT